MIGNTNIESLNRSPSRFGSYRSTEAGSSNPFSQVSI